MCLLDSFQIISRSKIYTVLSKFFLNFSNSCDLIEEEIKERVKQGTTVESINQFVYHIFFLKGDC